MGKKKANNFMLFVPVHSNKIMWEEKNELVTLIFKHDKILERLVRLFIKRPEVTTIELDEIGSTVWKLIDGRRNVYDIGLKIKELYGDKVEPTYERLNKYLLYLYQRRWIYWRYSNKVHEK